MNMNWYKHLKTINHHKWLVMKNCFLVGLYKQGLLHDLEYWVDYSTDHSGALAGCKMPEKYVVEMFCDRIAASKNYNKEKYNDSFPLEYFRKGKARKNHLLHPETDALLESLLVMLAEKGEDYTFDYIRREVLHNKRPKKK